MSSEVIYEYFPNLTEEQRRRFDALQALYEDWNAKINVISRKDIGNLYLHHVLHSLAIAKVIEFADDSSVMDVGTGGGFPGIPLAILYPKCHFLLVDSIGKKIRVCQAVIEALGLDNVEAVQERVEEEKSTFDFVVSRATMPMSDLVRLTRKNVDKKHLINPLPNGWLMLKGGELEREIGTFKKYAEVTDVSEFFKDEYFETKKVVYLPLS
ncbi:MAG: 16S rRNA (guanine(527)-N(7))-methyltransferase RsmG [Paludibacteraceae bacterium]|nr:16S rRNA (guanine(527)-N(7))-methyltransferase RsmG [Paludibacteraceae bacterium]MCR4619805.1 16S rRNA (guanine(527)-N(7))-methyltransferase RsmG [Paludibacteraceae bacterium]